MVTSGSQDDEMVGTLTQNARRGFDSRSRHNIFHFHHHPASPPLPVYVRQLTMYIIVSIKRLRIRSGMILVVCTDREGKEPHKQVGMGRVMTAWSLGGVMVSTKAQNARDLGSNFLLGTIFLIPISP